MKFRPCIDIHNGKVKQIVGGSLLDKGDYAQDNFVSEKDGDFYAKLYKDAGLEVEVVSGGGDIGETTAVYTGQVDFGVTWVSNLIAANAGGMDLIEIAQVYQRSGLVLVYKNNN